MKKPTIFKHWGFHCIFYTNRMLNKSCVYFIQILKIAMGDGSRILLNKIYDERQQENYHADFRDNVMEQLPASSAPSGIEDDSGFTDEASEIHRGGLIEDLLGPRFKQRNRDAGIHIHIGAVHYHGEPHPQGLYNDPSRYGYTQQPPQPCHPLRKNQYASSSKCSHQRGFSP